MSINNKIIQNLENYNINCQIAQIEDFLEYEGDFLDRQKKAIKIIENIMDVHGKKQLYRYISELARIEHGIRELEPWVRDHVVHAVLTYLLGLYINDNFMKLRFGQKVPNFQWKIAGLFHDIGYPLEISNTLLKSYSFEINKIKQELSMDTPDIIINISLEGIEQLTNDQNSFCLIQSCLNNWKLDIDAKLLYDESKNRGEICHGMVSSLTILYVLDLIYQKYNPKRIHSTKLIPNTNIDVNQAYFENDIIPACSAIFIHNLPKEYFKNKKINPMNAPVAFLLKLSDCLQEWERPSGVNENGFPERYFDIEIVSNFLIYKMEIPNKSKEKIIDEINSTSICTGLKII